MATISPDESARSRSILDWLDRRTNYRALWAPLERRVLPHGPSWWYGTASCLLWLLLLQLVTGLLLMATYSPSLTTAWESVHYIERSSAGAFIRGLHYFAAQAMIVLFALHVARVLLAAAFRAPREIIWITGLLLLPLMLVWTITGNPLSGTLAGLSQIEVEGNIIGSTPILGSLLREILLGGDRVGHLTLTHLYFLHVGLLPLLVGGLLAVHISQVYRHGISGITPGPAGKPMPYYPYQTVRNQIVLAGVMGLIAALAFHYGAPSGPPADPDLPHTPRPEWYFVWLFELRRYFTGDWEFIATLVLPVVVLVTLLAMPLFDQWLQPRFSFALRAMVVVLGLCGWGTLTGLSWWRDAHDVELQLNKSLAAALAERARSLAAVDGVPPEGAAAMLRNDPQAAGPLLFRRNCAACHSHTDENGAGIEAEVPSAPNLYRVGASDWIGRFLDPETIRSPHVFGHTKFATGDMVDKIDELFAEAAETGRDKLRRQLSQVAMALAAEGDPTLANEPAASAADVVAGRKLITGTLACTDCHPFHEEGEGGDGPDLTGYGSQAWLAAFIANPRHARFYKGERNDRMPGFNADPAHPELGLLSPREIALLATWLRMRPEANTAAP